MKYNSIEWLIRELDLDNDGPTMKAINKARAMHNEEMCQFAFDYNDEYCNNGVVPPVQDYYNEYFNTEEK